MDVARITISLRLLRYIVRESWRGKTLGRILLNHAVSHVSISGKILDLGSGEEPASYNRFLQYQNPFDITRSDFYSGGQGVIQMDLEKVFPIADASYGTVTCFNVLEHIYDCRNVIRESYRILTPGGRFIGSVPFLVNYHADPHDFFRYTHETLEKMFTEAGFTLEKITALSLGPQSAAAFFITRTLPRFFHPLVYLTALFADVIICRIKPAHRTAYSLGYVFIFRKS